MDEFPMIYGVSLVFYCLTCNDISTSNFKKFIFGSFSITFSIFMTISMIYYPKNPNFFFISFAIISIIQYFISLKFSFKIENGLKLWTESAIIILFSFLIWV